MKKDQGQWYLSKSPLRLKLKLKKRVKTEQSVGREWRILEIKNCQVLERNMEKEKKLLKYLEVKVRNVLEFLIIKKELKSVRRRKLQ